MMKEKEKTPLTQFLITTRSEEGCWVESVGEGDRITCWDLAIIAAAAYRMLLESSEGVVEVQEVRKAFDDLFNDTQACFINSRTATKH
jgi:hypothetical protein